MIDQPAASTISAAESFGIANGYAPSAHKVVLVDFDSTLYPWEPIMSEPDPLPGAVAAMQKLHRAGYRLVIFTSRLSPAWLAESGYRAVDQIEHIERLLRRDGIPYDEISSEKQPAQVYIDDRAIRFRPGDWPAIADWIVYSGDEP